MFSRVDQALSGANRIYPENYLLDRGVHHIFEASKDLFQLLWRLVRLKLGPDLF